MKTLLALGFVVVVLACSPSPEGLARAPQAQTTVKFDVFQRPLPELPLPNDFATRVDSTSATGMRINASMIAPTSFESTLRRLIDDLDGWGVFQPITIPFTGPLDVESIRSRHDDLDYDTSDDAVYVVNIDPSSEKYGQLYHLDIGNGNYPAVLEDRQNYWEGDPRGDSMSLLFEEADEDLNGNGVLDQGEDTDADGLLDVPNYFPGMSPDASDLAGRADALMTFYERQTNTLIVRLMEPLDERTRYAVVVTRRILDEDGEPIGSPFEFINHTSQTAQLEPLLDVMPEGLGLDEVAFVFPFTTQTIESAMVAVRDGLYGHGVQAHIGRDFPAQVDRLLPLRDASVHGDVRTHLMYGENWLEALDVLNQGFLKLGDDTQAKQALFDAAAYVDYFVVGQYESPQLFARYDENGNFLSDYNLQAWPEDLDRKPAKTVNETVTFTLMMPRREISARGQNQQVPVVIMSHGYTGSRFDVLGQGIFLAKFGIAVIGIDGPSHGLVLSPAEVSAARNIFANFGLESAGEALLTGRAFDQNGDGIADSGADFWTSYLFHTRDVVRQFALDYMQLIRILRSFDGANQWAFDVNGDGVNDLAGDFDGDGVVDIGAQSSLSMTGGSLGGIMSMVMGGLEPELDAVIPVAGGAGLMDVGFRSQQGGVPEGFFLLGTMGPLFTGQLDDSGRLAMTNVVADLNNAIHLPVGTVEGAAVGDLIVVENAMNGARGCGVVAPDGMVRASIEADRGDALSIAVFRDAYVVPGTDCELGTGASLVGSVNSWSEVVEFQGQSYAAGTELTALTHGLGRRRAHPDLRKMAGIAQMVIDPMDPVVYARHLEKEPLSFPGTGQSTATNALVVTTLGDMNVPASSGITYARSAGLVDFRHADSRYGKPLNQVLIDTHVAEAIDVIGRYVDGDGNPTHLDVENFSQGTDLYGANQPRLDPPLRAGMSRQNSLGGMSAAIFPMSQRTGQHGFDGPGKMADTARVDCSQKCETPDGCGCGSLATFDVGSFMMNMFGRYASTGGRELSADLCQSYSTCAWSPASAPPPRAELP